ncbi:MAG: hypothetical protein R3178_07715 [Rhodothermales bacterium]|nr:hypothetical protein [Rhodothermales bacterium]
MSFWRRYGIALLLLVVCTVIDVAVRILLDFNMVLVSAAETMLFGLTAAGLVWASDRSGADEATRRHHLVLAGLFGLGALRAGVWAASGDVMLANIVVLLIAAVAGLLAWRYLRDTRPDGHLSQADND